MRRYYLSVYKQEVAHVVIDANSRDEADAKALKMAQEGLPFLPDLPLYSTDLEWDAEVDQ